MSAIPIPRVLGAPGAVGAFVALVALVATRPDGPAHAGPPPTTIVEMIAASGSVAP